MIAFDAPLDLLKGAAICFCLRPPFMVLAVGLLRVGAHRDRHSLRGYQLVGKARQYAPLDVVATNGPAIVADPFGNDQDSHIDH